MKLISTILLLWGIIAAPGYYLYCSLFSGSSLERVTAFTQDVSSLGFGTMTIQSSGSNAKWNSPITLELTPEMNPISVTAHIRYMKPVSGAIGVKKRTEYRAELTKGNQELWNERFSVSSKRENKDKKGISIGAAMLPKTTTPIKSFSIEKSGQYSLSIKQKGDRDIAVANLDVDLRRNVILPNMKIVISGGIALLLAIAGFTLTRKNNVEPAP